MSFSSNEVDIIKPRIDNRGYRRIVFSNALEVLLISDPETDKAAASMDVSVGYFCDPEGLPGLAHFLEHMLFYASEKYPLEDSYRKYITEHGGSTNAFTSSEHTNFYFDVNVDCFEEALDRFAQFFISPLMSPDATLREIKAVDSEHQKNLLSDARRMYQLRKHLTSRNHPYHKFSTGNWDTLNSRPKENGLDTRLELVKFYEENYSANLMHLVVYGKDDLNHMQSLAESKFQGIRNIGRNYFHFLGQPCSPEHLQILVKAVPVKQGHTLRVTWPVTPSLRHYKEGPTRYLCHLIGHEGEGSLFFVLKQLGWAVRLIAGEDWSYGFSFFSVGIELTDRGQSNVEKVIGLLFKYVSLLRSSGVSKWVFDELAAISETGFHYQDKVIPSRYIVNIASNMQRYPPEDWLIASSVPSKFVPGTIQKILDELAPESVRIFCESKEFEGSTDFTEPWYGTHYSVEPVTSSLIQYWMDETPVVNLHLPKPNVFIPSDLTIKQVEEKIKLPVLLTKSTFSRLWYKPDTMFFTPKAYIKIDFNCPLANLSPEAAVLTDIFSRLLMDYLNEYAYDAQVAGLYYVVARTNTGFQVTVIGYNDKMLILLDTIIGKISQFEVKPDRFSVIKESLTKKYQNFKFQPPYKQARYYCSLLLEDQTWPWNEEFQVLPHLEADDLAKFVKYLLERAFLEFYIAGNVQPSEAKSVVKLTEDALFKAHQPKVKALFPSQHLTNRVVRLERGIRYNYPMGGLNQNDENSAIVHYIQVHQDDIKLNVRLQLFVLIAKQPAFHQLRSVEQLGYLTALMQRNDSGVRGLQFIIQSTVKDPANLDTRVGAFLQMFENKLYELTDEEYKSNVNALIDMKLEKHKNLREESAFFWREIVDGTLRFDRRESEVAALRELKKAELIEFFKANIKVDSPQRKSLSVQIFGGRHSAEFSKVIQEEDAPGTCKISDIFSFRRSRPLYGSFKGGIGHLSKK